ncbi:MAG TPA: hypothetical protein VJJ76_02615 [archaeon]|nr:hypothetical protein [archaeon]
MGFWDRFKKKPKDDAGEISDLNMNMKNLPTITAEVAGSENVRAKMDLVLMQIESLNIRLETFNQRMERLERMVQEIWTIAKQG